VNFGDYDSASYSASYPDDVIKGTGYSSNCDGWTISRSYAHNAAHYCIFCANGFDGATVEYSRIQNGWGKEAIRGQIVFKNGTIRYNQFVNSCGQSGGEGEGCTAEIALWDGGAGAWDGNKIYGNYFYRTRDENSGGTIVVGGNGGSWAGSPASSTLVYNNTIAGISGSVNTGGNILVNGGSGNICRNNLGYDIAGTFSVTCSTTSSNGEESSDPFVNYASGNLHLSAGIAGTTIASPYDTDMDGVTRGGDGTWDRGAYEYGASVSAPVLTSPISITVSRPVTFEWEAFTGALKYQIQVDDNADYSSPEVDVEIDCLGLCDETDTTYETATDDLLPSTTYYWHVKALR
jgi:hypothetical protein